MIFASAHIATETVPNQYLAQISGALPIDELFGICKLDIHIGVHRDKSALVFGLSPLQTDESILADASIAISIRSLCLDLGAYSSCSIGRGFFGTNCAAS